MPPRITTMSEQYHTNRQKRIPVKIRWFAAVLFATSLPWSTQAQLRLPALPNPTNSVQLPALPNRATDVTSRLDSIVANTASELDSQSERLLRAARIRALLRANPNTLDTDANGAPVLRGQVIALSPTPESLQAVIAAGFVVVQDESMNDLNIRLVTLETPKGMTAQRALRRLHALDGNGNYDYNHVYTQSAASNIDNKAPVTAGSMSTNSDTYGNTRVGLIDGGVDATHAVFHTNHIHNWGCDQQAVASAHGTAVASLLVGHSEKFNGAAPGAELYAADVYCGQPVGGAISRIASAIAWLAQQQIPVINISLVGPDNVILKNLISSLVARGYLVVAAVGNDGPAAPPLFPASYPGVVGVTAVDARNRVIVEAGRGKQVTFAALGADMVAATPQNGMISVRGTSFAAPLVAGLLATHIDNPNQEAAKAALNTLINEAHDLGPTGYDTTYGYGVVGSSLRATQK